jgi:hypothetical protein
MTFSMELKDIHDELLNIKPEGASHDKESCAFCNVSVASLSNPEGGSVDKTYTEDELNVAIANATKDLETQITTLKTQTEQSAFEGKVAEATAALTEQVKELESKLDGAVLEAQSHKEQYEALVAYLEAAKAEAEAQAEIAARRDERLEKVREVASFPEEYLVERADAWAQLSDEDFEAAIADWKALGLKKELANAADAVEAQVPAATAMQANRSDTGSKSAIRDVLSFRNQGIDPRTL